MHESDSPNWLMPWRPAQESTDYVAELHRELPRGHVLRDVPVSALAYRQDRDDVLFAFNDGSDRVAVVHLTFRVENDPRWPITDVYESIEDFANRCMAADHEEYES
jgi:hypothetical protein